MGSKPSPGLRALVELGLTTPWLRYEHPGAESPVQLSVCGSRSKSREGVEESVPTAVS